MVKHAQLSDLRIMVALNKIESTVLEVDEQGMYRCYFEVREGTEIVRYSLVTQRSNTPRPFKNPGTISRILKAESIHHWRVVNVNRK